jgi:hypothetical protein
MIGKIFARISWYFVEREKQSRANVPLIVDGNVNPFAQV